MLILGLLSMYFDAAVVFFMISSLLLRMAMAVLCPPLIASLFIYEESYQTKCNTPVKISIPLALSIGPFEMSLSSL